MIDMEKITAQLNAREKEERLAAVRELKAAIDRGEIPAVARKGECDNHIHSQFSFSPYSPSMIAWKAYEVGLDTCGIVDHESVAGCLEFREACQILGVVPTIGFEVRMNWDNTPLKDKKFNNPDQLSVGYFPVHGVPLQSLDKVEAFLKPIRAAREKRNRKMTEKVNAYLTPFSIQLDFDRDVIPVSRWEQQGSITERHILFATALKLIEHCGKGQPLIDFLETKLEIPVPAKAKEFLMDTDSTIYTFDLTNVLKGYFSEVMYVDAGPEETPDVRTAVPYLNSLGCITTYTYLGDVRGTSVTGDKKTQKFEDDVLDEMFACLSAYGMRGFSYAPTRNQPDQVERVRALCRKYGMLEVCGEDINQPRQPLICQQNNEEDRLFFNDSTWAIIGHEMLAAENLENSIISDATVKKYPDLNERIQAYKAYALEHMKTQKLDS